MIGCEENALCICDTHNSSPEKHQIPTEVHPTIWLTSLSIPQNCEDQQIKGSVRNCHRQELLQETELLNFISGPN